MMNKIIDNTHIKNMQWLVSPGRIEEKINHLYFKNVLYWAFKYKFLTIAIYYDPDSSLSLSQPYFEILVNNPVKTPEKFLATPVKMPERFLATPVGIQNMFDSLIQYTRKHDIEIIEHPEYFL